MVDCRVVSKRRSEQRHRKRHPQQSSEPAADVQPEREPPSSTTASATPTTSAEAPASSCLLCGEHELTQGRCARCGAQQVLLTTPPPRFRVRGQLRTSAPAHYDVELPTGLHVEVRTSAATELLPPDNLKRHPLQAPAELAVLGHAELTFEEHHEGLREPAHEVYRIDAQLLAWGPGCDDRLDLALAALVPTEQPSATVDETIEEDAPWTGPGWPDTVVVSKELDAAGRPRHTIKIGTPRLHSIRIALLVLAVTFIICLVANFRFVVVGPASLVTLLVLVFALDSSGPRTTLRIDDEELRLTRRPFGARTTTWRCPRNTIREVKDGGGAVAIIADGGGQELLLGRDAREREASSRALRSILGLEEPR